MQKKVRGEERERERGCMRQFVSWKTDNCTRFLFEEPE